MPPESAAHTASQASTDRGRFYLLFSCLLIIGAGNSMLSVVLPPLIRRLNLPDSSIGWIFSLSALLWVAASPRWGRLSNRTGRKPIISSGLLAYCISMGSLALAVIAGLNGWIAGAVLFASLVLTRAIFGAFGSAASPAAQAYIADNTPAVTRTQALASLTAAFALEQTLGPAFASGLAFLGAVFPIAAASVLAGIGAFATWRFLPEAKRAPTPISNSSTSASPYALARDERISGYLIYGFGLSVVTGTLSQTFALYVMDVMHVGGNQGAQFSGPGFMLNALALMATQMLILPRLNLDARALMIWGGVVLGLGVAVQAFSGGLVLLWASQIVQGMGFGLARPGFTGGASLAVTADEQGPSAGLVVAMNGAGFVFSPIAGGVAYEYWGMHAPLIIALIMLVGLTVFATLSRRLKGRAVLSSASIGGPQ